MGRLQVHAYTGLLKTELKENNHKTSLEDTNLATHLNLQTARLRWQILPSTFSSTGWMRTVRLDQKTSLARNYRSETQTNHSNNSNWRSYLKPQNGDLRLEGSVISGIVQNTKPTRNKTDSTEEFTKLST